MTSEQKYLVKVVDGPQKGEFFKAVDQGVTSHLSEAYRYTAHQLHHGLVQCRKGRHVLIPTIPFNTAEPQPYEPIQD